FGSEYSISKYLDCHRRRGSGGNSMGRRLRQTTTPQSLLTSKNGSYLLAQGTGVRCYGGNMKKQLLSRREFNGLCAALGSSLPTISTSLAALSSGSAFAAAPNAASNDAKRTVKFRDGVIVPALGQGSAQLGVGRRPQAVEEEALLTGLSLGMT